MRFRMGLTAAVSVVVLLSAGCGGDDDTKAEDDQVVPTASDGGTGGGSGGAGDLRTVDACAVLTAEQVSKALAMPGLSAVPNALGCDYGPPDNAPVVSTIATRSKTAGGVDKALAAYLGTLGDVRTEKVPDLGDSAVYVQPGTIGGVLLVAVGRGDETALFSLNAGGGEPSPTRDQLVGLAKEALVKL
ncbi:hypothetical protein [Streptomyces sp. SID3343]|uniref:hypothetical protein n=1 Tax=Streptomyces sp. SID3343 TaxID=2690260 RepID=UPI00136DED39|nr:hypothetical protein [Streptomyces sp. SID3343]MYW05826.1 hypothetical protein [Streptomyces sp. SID3343]